MIDKVSKLAERVAASLSRRGFLGRVGHGASGFAAAVCGLVGFSASAEDKAAEEKRAFHGCCKNGKCPKPPGRHVKFRGTQGCQTANAVCVWLVNGQVVNTPCT